jgi:hypothetical protein
VARFIAEWPPGDQNKALHINQPNDCRCATAIALAAHPSAVFFNSVETAAKAGFTDQCASCEGNGDECTFN